MNPKIKLFTLVLTMGTLLIVLQLSAIAATQRSISGLMSMFVQILGFIDVAVVMNMVL